VKTIPSTYNEKDKSMSFNLWANINDVDNNKGIDYKGDIELYVTDKNGSSQSIYIRMPKEKNTLRRQKIKYQLSNLIMEIS